MSAPTRPSSSQRFALNLWLPSSWIAPSFGRTDHSPLRTVRATFMAHGSLVSLFPELWPVVVHIHMTPPAERDALAFACHHDLHPERFLPPSLLVQVCQMSYVMHLDVFLAFTYFAGVF